MKFMEQVLFVRAKLNISQEALAKKLNVSFATVNRWEHGHTNPRRKTQVIFTQFCKDNRISFTKERTNE